MIAPLLREEMDARGWSVDDLCRAANLSPEHACGLLAGTRRATPALARALGRAFGTSAAFWRRLDALPPVR